MAHFGETPGLSSSRTRLRHLYRSLSQALETGSESGTAPGGKLMSHPASMDDRVFCEAAMTGLLGIRMYRVGGDPGLELPGTLNIPVANCVAPAAADGRLVVRTLNAVCCYELRREHAPDAARPKDALPPPPSL
jgi:hypothetical protein